MQMTLKELFLNNVVELSQEQADKIYNDVFADKNKDYHYIIFGKDFGFVPVDSFLSDVEEFKDADKSDIYNKLISELSQRKEVCSLYPKANLSIYPWEDYSQTNQTARLDIKNIDKHFADLLYLNDKVLRTPFIYVDFSTAPINFDREFLYKYFRELMEKSAILKHVYIDF